MTILRPLVQMSLAPVVGYIAVRTERTISAMVRIRNEEQFLRPAIKSIIDDVDEVVLIDNLSTDSTPELIAALQQEHPGKVKAAVYQHVVARPGQENLELASTAGGLRSPQLLANYYNWCLGHCTKGFVLKWDADMVATPSFHRAAQDFRTSRFHLLYFGGENLHENRTHLIAGHPVEDAEPRFFPRRFARYDNGFAVWERLRSPYDRLRGMKDFVPTPCYVHMKYCKNGMFDNISQELVAEEREFARPGEPVSDEVRATVEFWKL